MAGNDNLILTVGALAIGGGLAYWLLTQQHAGGVGSCVGGTTSSVILQLSATKNGNAITANVNAQNVEVCTRSAVIVVEVRDSQGVTQDLQYQSVSIPPSNTGSTDSGFTFQGLSAGSFTVRAACWTSLDNPIPLSDVVIKTVVI